MVVIHRQGINLMASLCRDADRLSRRSIQIRQQCELCVNQTLLRRLHHEQRLIEKRLKNVQQLISGINSDLSLDPLALEFASEVAQRAILKTQSSVN